MSDRPEASERRRQSLMKLGVMAIGLIVGGIALRLLSEAVGTDWIDRDVKGQGLWGEALFLGVGTIATAVGVPRQAVIFLGGYAFGPWIGALLAMIAQGFGCALSFYWARAVGRGWAERRLAGRFGHRLRPLADTLRQNTFGATLALRLLPIGNNLALNLLAGMSGVSPSGFMLGSLLGYLPQTVVFVMLGDGVAVAREWQIALGAALLVLASAIGMWLLRRHKAGRVMESE